MSQMAYDAAPARSGSTAGGARRRAPLERVGACLVLVSILCGLAALWGYFLGGQQAEWGASIDGSYVSDGSASRSLKFDVSNSVLALATVLAMSLTNLTFGACSSSSSGSFSRKCAALLLICCILGAELPQAEALTKPVVDGEGLRRTPFDLADGQAAGAANQRSNDSASADVPEDYASSRHLLSLDGVLGDVAAPPSQMPTELLEMSGITDADQSPTPPAEFLKQERDVEKVSDEMSKEMRISKKRQEKMAARVKKLDEMISDQLSNVATSVKEENTKLTNEIVEVPGVPGPKGAPGIDGAPGAPGKNGIHGRSGDQGPTGKQGIHGVPGPVGVKGKRGPYGPEGVSGLPGIKGSGGTIGPGGPQGIQGLGSSWKGQTYFCPEAKTATMKMEKCTDKGCLLETKFEDTWGTVCSDGLSNQDAFMLCKAFGFPEGGVAKPNIGGGKAEQPIWLNHVKCMGDEGDVADCKHDPWLENHCQHTQDAGLCCFGGRPTGDPDVRKSASFFPRCPEQKTPDMRTVDCNRHVCRLEVKHKDQWGTVCDNGFTQESANVVCKLLGFPKAKFRQMCSSNGKYGGCAPNTKGKGPIWLDDVVCSGFERDLEGCRHRPWGEHKCTHKQDVGICCSGEKGDVYQPGKCRGGELYYKFNENLESTSGGPELSAPWGAKFKGVEGVRFKEGQGLGVDPSGCIGPDEYTIYARVKLDSTTKTRTLIHSNGWKESGVFIKDGALTVLPDDTELKCDEKIIPDKWYQYVMSRDKDGNIRVYLNGALCQHGKPDIPKFLQLNPDQLMFVADYGLRNGEGYVNKIRVFNKVLSEDKVARICGCKLPGRDKVCQRHIAMSPANSGLRFSSVYSPGFKHCSSEGGTCQCTGEVRYGAPGQWSEPRKVNKEIKCSTDVFGDPAVGIKKTCQCKLAKRNGFGYASGRMNSKQGWTAGKQKAGEWMQVDTGDVQSISGVITQGRRNANEWVTTFTVSVSEDGKLWRQVQCGRTFGGNVNRNTKVKNWFHEPVHARYIRFYPQTWERKMSMRAGVLVCERPCLGGKLNYQFRMSMMSTSLGPALEAAWGEGEFNEAQVGDKKKMVYQFLPGEGLQVDQGRCMKEKPSWTILINVALADTIGYRRILGTEKWGDFGLYVNKYLMLVPKNSHIMCHEVIRPGKFYRFVISRSKEGEIKLYINGEMCASGKPPYKNNFQLDPHNVMFMRDDSGENSGGQLANIQMWDKELPESEVEAVCQCTRPDIGEKCKFQVIYNAPTSRTHYSSVFNDDMKGVGYGRGRIGSQSAWNAKVAEIGQYMQMDSGKVQTISGIVTQGRRDADQWVTSYTVHVSSDGSDWREVGCGTEFDANSDRRTKVRNLFNPPVKARYVRVFPQSWKGWLSMRAGLLMCEKPCKDNRLDYSMGMTFGSRTDGPSLDPAWGEGLFEGDLGYKFAAGQGFELDASRCFPKIQAWTMIMTVRLDQTTNGRRALMTTDKWDDDTNGLYVDQWLRLAPTGANMVCDEKVIKPNVFYTFGMVRDAKGEISLYVDGARCAKGSPPFKDNYQLDPHEMRFLRDNANHNSGGYVKSIRLWGKGMDEYEVANKCSCLLPTRSTAKCNLGLIPLTGTKKTTKFSSVLGNSKFGRGNAKARLGSTGGWFPAADILDEYIQIDTGRVQTISGVVTQGARGGQGWVTFFKVKVSEDGFQWKDVRCQWIFQGNTDASTKVRTLFNYPIEARFVRIIPTKWHKRIGLRAAVLICMLPCKNGELKYRLDKGNMLSQTDGPALDASWGSGYFDGDNGYKFAPGKGLQVNQDEEGCMNEHRGFQNGTIPEAELQTAYTLVMDVKLDTTSGWRSLIRSKGWGDNGLYVNGGLRLQGGQMKCTETIHAQRWYQIAMTRDVNSTVSLYINGHQCASGSPMKLKGFMLDRNNIDFFHDDGNENSGGSVKEIIVLNKALDREEMSKIAGCKLSEEGKKCKRTIVFSPQVAQTKYSSIFNNDRAGYGHGRGRLNSKQAWSALNTNEVQYMQIDSGEVRSIAGVVTQGRRDAAQWVKSFTVQTSNDGISWTPVQCGEEFQGNSDQMTKVKTVFRWPVRARFIRIYPTTWQWWISMRAGLLICERKCVAGQLDYTFGGNFMSSTKGPNLDAPWGEGSWDDLSQGYRFNAGQGLVVDESRCVNPSNFTVLVQARLDTTSGWRKLMGSDGWGDYGMYVNTQFQLFPSSAMMKCDERILPNTYYTFMLSRGEGGVVSMYLNGYKCTWGVPPFVHGFKPSPTSMEFFHSEKNYQSGGYVKRIAVWDRALTDEECARESECKLADVAPQCNTTVTLIPNYSRMRSSGAWGNALPNHHCGSGRLGSHDAWCSNSNRVSKWLEIDVGYVHRISGVVTQGRKITDQWVTSYKVMVSKDGVRWFDVQCGGIFQANRDRNTKVVNLFERAVIARYVRIFPQTWVNHMSMRAGAIICEKGCKSGELDYQFLNDFQSQSLGPELDPKWGYNQFSATKGYRVYHNRGLSLDPHHCVTGDGSWTIQVKARVDFVHGWRRIVNSMGWGDNGLYIRNGLLTMFPTSTSIACTEYILPNRYYKFTMSRSAKHEITLYINGYKCASGYPTTNDGFALDPKELSFFHDDGNEYLNGWVRRIRIWDRVLAPEEVAEVSGCALIPTQGEKCQDTITVSPEYRHIKYSSTWAHDRMGYRHGRGRLNSPQAWSSRYNHRGQWMQFDVEKVQTIAGVVTQGRRDCCDQWVTGFKVSISTDGKRWRQVQCGMTFTGNNDRNTKVVTAFDRPIQARYVRIYPTRWHNHMSMRAAVMLCEQPCKKGKIDYRFRGSLLSKTDGPGLLTPWGTGYFAGRYGYRFGKGQGLSLNEKNCIKGDGAWSIKVETRLDSVNNWARIMGSEAWGDYGLFVKEHEFMMFPRSASLRCRSAYIERNRFYTYWLTRSDKGKISIYINGYLCAEQDSALVDHFALSPTNIDFFHDAGDLQTGGYVKDIAMWDKLLPADEIASMSGCLPPKEEKPCDRNVVFNAAYKQVTFSSVWGRDRTGWRHGTSRLDSYQGWSAGRNDLNQFMQIDVGKVRPIAGVVTQGRAHAWQWVKAYSVEISSDGVEWQNVQCGAPFRGNVGVGSAKVTQLFSAPVKARFVKIKPTSWHGHISMRAGLVLCEEPCQDGELDFTFDHSFLSTTDGPALETPWGDGSFSDGGYRFSRGRGMRLAESSCIKDQSAYSIIIDAKLDNAHTWNRLLSTSDWGRYGLFVLHNKFRLYPDDLEMTCQSRLFNRDTYKFGITREAGGTVRLYLDGWLCAEGEPIDAPQALKLNKDNIDFFHDPSNLHSGGTVSRIRLWDKALDSKKMATAMACKPAEISKDKCSSVVVLNPPYSQHKYSDVLGSASVGHGWARGRLNSPRSWIAPYYGRNWWMQMDSGEVQPIAGVVTQGRGDGYWWTKSFYVKASIDGRRWRKVECGRVFQGNRDAYTQVRNLFDKPIKARYIRIYPQESHGYPSLRAGVLVCERPCKGKALDFNFDNQFTSLTKGPSLIPAWGDGRFVGTSGYRFNRGQGLQLDEANCIKDKKEWSVLIETRFDQTNNWRSLIGADGWGTNGLFIADNQLQTRPQDLACPETIRPHYWYKFGITRESSGVVRLFINGYMCAEGKPLSPKKGFELDEHNIEFFKGSNGEDTAGYVRRVQMWGTAKTSAEMAEAAGCSKPSETGTCKGEVEIVERNSLMKASSTWGDAAMGTGYAKGSLNSDLCWMSKSHTRGNKKEWLQLDTGKLQSIVGVVTRGCHARNWFTRTFKVKVSEDGRRWKWVECGRIFDGNNNWHEKKTNLFQNPVKARYIRFYPQTYYYLQAMRVAALVCEADCKEKELDYKMRDSFVSSTGGPSLAAKNVGTFSRHHGYRFHKDNGLDLEQQRCFKDDKAYTILMDVRLDSVTGYNGLVTIDDWNDNGYYIGNGKFRLRPTDIVCENEMIRPNIWYKLGISRDKDGDITLYINGYPCANGKPKTNKGFVLTDKALDLLAGPDGQASGGYIKRVRLWGKSMSDDDMQKLTSCRLPKEAKGKCEGSVIRNVPYARIRASSVCCGHRIAKNYYYGRARLNAHGAWLSSTSNRQQWLQLDTGKVQNIFGVITQGRYHSWQWVTSYKVRVSKDGIKWYDVECGRIFDGNKNYREKVKNEFAKPVQARYVRINPQSWYGRIAMRAAVLICEGDCKDKHLQYDFDDQLASTTDGPSLHPHWGEGYYHSSLGYRVNLHQGFLLKQTNCIKSPEEYSIIMLARVDWTHDWKQLIGSNDWGENGVFIRKTKFSLKPDNIQCSEYIHTRYFYYFGITRNKKGEVKLYLNGYECASGSPPVLEGYKMGKDLTFFHSFAKKNNEDTAGWVKKIEVWGKVLDGDEMAKESQCVKPKEAEKCKGKPLEATVPYHRRSASSVRWGYGMGSGWGQSGLNAHAGWVPSSYSDNQWLQFDLGKVMAVSGVRMQGVGSWYRWYYGSSWTTWYEVQVSTDRSTWRKVECGKLYQANTNTDTKVTSEFTTPVEARYVRVIPKQWYRYPGFRASIMVCESTCKSKMLDYKFHNSLASADGGPPLTTPWGFAHYYHKRQYGLSSSESPGYRFWTDKGLKLTGEDTCISDPKTYTVLMHMRWDDVPETGLRALMTSTNWGDSGLYIDDEIYSLKPNANLKCTSYKVVKEIFYKFGMTRAKDGTVTLYINGQKCASAKAKSNDGFALKTDNLIFFRAPNGGASYHGFVHRLRIWDKVLTEAEMQSMSGCQPANLASSKCDSIVANVRYERIRYSSVAGNQAPGIGSYGKGRLNSDYGWWPASTTNQWMQMDTGKVQTISGVVTQGRKNSWHWVSLFRVEVSDDGNIWKDVECGKPFKGNKDYTNTKKNHFTKPVIARYVRIYPLKWRSHPSMRAAVMICETDCSDGHLDYKMDGMRSSTGGPVLTAPWGEGRFVPQVKDPYCSYGAYNYAYHWVRQPACDKLCKANPACAGYTVYSSGYPGCWLRSKMSQRHRYESQSYDSYFNTNSLTYKTTAPIGYKFEKGKGLSLDIEHCIKDTSSYTILIQAMVQDVSHWRRIVSSTDWGDKGLFIHNGKLSIYPSASDLKCDGLIRPDYVYTFGMSRSDKGEIKIYLNGYLCATGSPTWANGYKLKDDNVDFFADSSSRYMTGGVIRRIQIWDKTLTEKEIGTQSGCKPATTSDAKCKDIQRFKATAQNVDYSSIYNRDDIGSGYGQGWVINGRGSWRAANAKSGEWMQIDLGKVRNVTGVVTRGNHHHNWQVTAFTVAVSKDNENWADVECGKMFETPYRGYWQRRRDDRITTFDKMNEGRYVRIIVNEWYGVPSMRMEVEYCADPPPPPPKKEKEKEKETSSSSSSPSSASKEKKETSSSSSSPSSLRSSGSSGNRWGMNGIGESRGEGGGREGMRKDGEGVQTLKHSELDPITSAAEHVVGDKRAYDVSDHGTDDDVSDQAEDGDRDRAAVKSEGTEDMDDPLGIIRAHDEKFAKNNGQDPEEEVPPEDPSMAEASKGMGQLSEDGVREAAGREAQHVGEEGDDAEDGDEEEGEEEEPAEGNGEEDRAAADSEPKGVRTGDGYVSIADIEKVLGLSSDKEEEVEGRGGEERSDDNQAAQGGVATGVGQGAAVADQ